MRQALRPVFTRFPTDFPSAGRFYFKAIAGEIDIAAQRTTNVAAWRSTGGDQLLEEITRQYG